MQSLLKYINLKHWRIQMNARKFTASALAAFAIAAGGAAVASTAVASAESTTTTTTNSFKAVPHIHAGDHRGSAIGLPHNQHRNHLGQPGNH
jgi:hypothetical protein